MQDIPGLDPDGKIPGGIEVAGNVEAAAFTEHGQPLQLSLPGVTPDGLTPPGIAIAGILQAGDQNAVNTESQHLLYGSAQFVDVPGSLQTGDDLLTAVQQTAIPNGGFGASALSVARSGSIATKDYSTPMSLLKDNTASAQPAVQCEKAGGNGPALLVKGKFASSNSAVHSLGAYSGNAIPVYDAANTLLGYIPIYA